MKKTNPSLHERLMTIANQYASQFSEVIGYDFQSWIAEDISIDMADFGDINFFSLADMQIVIDHLADWIARYGSKEKVGEVVLEYNDTLIENESKTFENGSPRINLWSWMKGLRWKNVGISIECKC